MAVEERRRLVGGQQAIVLQHVESEHPRLVRVQDDANAADAVDRRVDALRRKLHHAFALERRTRFVEDDHVARPGLRPMQAEGQDQVAVVPARHGHREMVVDPFLQLVQHGEPMGGSKLDLRLRDRIDCARGSQRVNGHDGPLRKSVRSKYTEDRGAS